MTTATRLDRMPSPSFVHADMARIRRAAAELDRAAEVLDEMYEELYEASLTPISRDGGGLPPGKDHFNVSDPTGDIATSAMHARMRKHARRVATKLKKLQPILEEAENMIQTAFLETDPEFAEKLRRLREIEQEQA